MRPIRLAKPDDLLPGEKDVLIALDAIHRAYPEHPYAGRKVIELHVGRALPGSLAGAALKGLIEQRADNSGEGTKYRLLPAGEKALRERTVLGIVVATERGAFG